MDNTQSPTSADKQITNTNNPNPIQPPINQPSQTEAITEPPAQQPVPQQGQIQTQQITQPNTAQAPVQVTDATAQQQIQSVNQQIPGQASPQPIDPTTNQDLPSIQTQGLPAQPGQPASNQTVDQQKNSEPENNDEPTISKRKKVVYFLVGLIFNFLALIPIVLWIIIKVKRDKKPRFLYFIAGLLFAMLLGLIAQYTIVPQFIQNKFPELIYAHDELSLAFPEYQIGVDAEKSFTDDPNSNSEFIVSVVTESSLSRQDFKDIGTKTCQILENGGYYYNTVSVQQVDRTGNNIAYFDLIKGTGATCQEWRETPIEEMLIPE